ncbi:hypothetical protein [Novosphingobium colocasiae]|uniref:Uncharacterized protein n=1 Tax=Novosphingobium colocasiae TaxID=1256513 RepID=A0A918UGX7_9SPHN|nr:hypothetical protein [Novosphingobium colocasiae]GGZ07617.1 hypothetical protein GCM10011614_23190 [Novosphingobium colocasiae]
MKKFLTRLGLGTVLAATALTVAVPSASARGYNDSGDDVAIAVGAGILGLAVGAAIADRDDDRYYDRGYYGHRRYVTVRDRPGYYYYYAGRPNRYYRDRYYDRYYAPYYRERWGRSGNWGRGYYDRNRWDDRRDRWDRRHDRRHDRWDRRDDRWHDRHDHDDRRWRNR